MLGLTALLLGAALGVAAQGTPPAGRSTEGRPLQAVARGAPDAATRVLVVGGMHGDEPGGRAVTRALARRIPPAGTRLWVVHDLNPDGSRRRARGNARGVDLNRNFPHRWRSGARGRFWPGPRGGSERETRWAMGLVRAVRPRVTVWLHQPYGIVVDTPGADLGVLRRYARRTRLPLRRLPRYRGTVAGWQNARSPKTSAFVVELGAGRPSARTVRRHVEAILAAAREARPRVRSARNIPAALPRRPRIRPNPIPFASERKRQMRRYARRHYGLDAHLLRDPKVVVEHATATSTFGPVFDTFAANRPDPELRELPGTCAHFVVDRDGTIHQLVPLGLMCRHTIGLNHRSIGIEHVGRSDGQVLGNRRQLEASLRLTRWLQHRHDIRTEDVIGHAESLSSPHHAERVPHLRRRTHGDFPTRAMRRYRSALSRLPKP